MRYLSIKGQKRFAGHHIRFMMSKQCACVCVCVWGGGGGGGGEGGEILKKKKTKKYVSSALLPTPKQS